MIRNAVIFVLASVMIVRADQAADTLTAAGVAEFTAAYQAWDGERFGKAAEYFRQAEEKSPSSAINQYWRGVALFHRMLQVQSMQAPTAAMDAMDAALAPLEASVTLDPSNAESHALLGTLYGMKIGGSIFRAIRYGPTVQSHQQKALKYGPMNPRVRYLLGAGQYNTAKDAAARREARDTLLAAEKLFNSEARQPVTGFEPRWGYSSCLTFIARAYESLGEMRAAQNYYRMAHAAHPADQRAMDGINRTQGK